MPRLHIRNERTGEVLFSGAFPTAKDCAEQALREGVCLDYADLRYANLANAALDDACLRHARLDGANLAGANMSEALLDGTSFTGATMTGACLCFSAMDNCNFDGALFGATDIAGAKISKGRFSTLSAFTLNFIDAAMLGNCVYKASNGAACAFSAPPVFIQGLAYPVVFMDTHLKIGAVAKTYAEWFDYMNDNAAPADADNPESFFRRYKDIMAQIRRELGDRGRVAAADVAA